MKQRHFFVIPMCGESKRFFSAGYNVPKFMLPVDEQFTIFDLSIMSLPFSSFNSTFIFIINQQHNEKYAVASFIENRVSKINCLYKQDKITQFEIVVLAHRTRGQAETVYCAKDYVLEELPMSIYNIDTYFRSNSLANMLSDDNIDGVLGAFYLEKEDPKWSFAKLDENGFVIETAEKQQISSYALTGFYNFRKAKDFFDVARDWIENNHLVRGEFYVAPMYNSLIKRGYKYKIDIADEFVALGTPEDYEKVCRIDFSRWKSP